MSYQSATGGASAGGTSIACTFAAVVQPGNGVHVHITWAGTTGNLNTVTDDKGNSYTVDRKVAHAGTGEACAIAYLLNIANGPITITANFGASVTFRSICAAEETRAMMAAFDVSALQAISAPGTGADLVTSGAATATALGDLVVGDCIDASLGGQTMVAGSGFTARITNIVASGTDQKTEDRVLASAASVAATWTDSTNGGTSTYIVGMMAFMPLMQEIPDYSAFPKYPLMQMLRDQRKTNR